MNSFDFDKSFSRTYRVAWIAMVIGWVVSLTVVGGVAWVVWHFVSKYW